jgi:hypothetical protein
MSRRSRHPKVELADSCEGTVLTLAWRTHLSLKTPIGRHLTAQVLQDRLRRARESTARTICPREVELQIFDPNACSCLTYEGSHLVDWQFMAPPKDWKGKKPFCLHAKEASFAPRWSSHPFKRKHAGTGGLQFNVWGSSLIVAIQNCNTRNGVDLTFMQTALILSPKIDFFFGGKNVPHTTWFNALDPNSWALAQDTEGYGVFWCREERCRNHLRHGVTRLPRTYPYSRDCTCIRKPQEPVEDRT